MKKLEEALYEIKGFENPKVQLEQYPTSAHLAACVVYTMFQQGDIENKRVGDFGCGTGILSIASSLMGASYFIIALYHKNSYTCGFDIDDDALSIAQENITNYELNIDLVKCDISKIEFNPNNDYLFDTIVMNPPFGTRDKGIDMKFVEKALTYSPMVYSLHKTSTKAYILKKSQQWKVKCKAIAHLIYDIPKMYKFHNQKSKDIEVDLFQFSKL